MARKLTFTSKGWADYASWADDRKMLARVNLLIRECLRTPTEGLAKPKPMRGDLAGAWSRRIDERHRLVYLFTDHELEVIACRLHTTE
ncbi:Txe/YoeB family addiction module toxin [Luteibacter aegosomaticola]|jgi:toxin YoeB|uniref:Txe/YoeB family addiction module toxin n=1 Tax=Luteibacter aegosomaticola TaxID=2911538 RepID=UPI001FFA9ABC|nr:Txe/YoeB family addiction module toxin [Luteibacter aegosomaticola]UPG87999.1 Txe/YoeB family addiction module toxin [Luteibacter aegosomaticola]